MYKVIITRLPTVEKNTNVGNKNGRVYSNSYFFKWITIEFKKHRDMIEYLTLTPPTGKIEITGGIYGK